jgi:hypothetical protein
MVRAKVSVPYHMDNNPSDHTSLTAPLLPQDHIPEGNYEVWTPEETHLAEHIARCFALEYVYDFSARNAAIRLGFDHKAAAEVGRKLLNHWLTQRCIRKLEQRFEQDKLVTADRVLSLLYRDASNYSPGSNPIARVSAQKNLVTLMGLAKPKQVEVTTKAGAGGAGKMGGVMMVPFVMTPDQWEQHAENAQRALQQESRGGDSA